MRSQSASDYAVQVTTSVTKEPPQIQLNWQQQPSSTDIFVYRKSRDETNWGTPIPLPGDASSYTDSAVVPGKAYEYKIWRRTLNYDSRGYVYAGIDIPLVESRGKVVLVVDRTYASDLSFELERLQQDLVGDGWFVLRHDVHRMAVDPADTNLDLGPARSNEVAQVKSMIKADYLADPSQVSAVFLFGHVPVPYSGAMAPDGHAEHFGAWPADLYYGDMQGVWTDSLVTNKTAVDPRNFNVPGDGKFDQSTLPGPVVLEVGRVDMANLPALPASELELLRQYLNKDHDYRHKLVTTQIRALIDDNFGVREDDVPAANAWANFAPLVDPSNISTGRWLTILPRNDYLWSYGNGAGKYSSAEGVADTGHFAAYEFQVVFTLLFGSFFGDWDSQNNLLRAPLAAANYTLTSAWAGRPYWFFHHMSLGETIGFSTRLSQNNSILYQPTKIKSGGLEVSTRDFTMQVHVALMGDPTLRMQMVDPPRFLTAVTNALGGVDLNWEPSADEVLGYNVYGAAAREGPYLRLNDALVTSTNLTDSTLTSQAFYMVRAVALQQSTTGTYLNSSQSAFAEAILSASPADNSLWPGRGMQTWNFNDVAGAAGADPGWDYFKIPETLTITSDATNQFTVKIVSTLSDHTPGPAAHFDNNSIYVWPLLTAAGGVIGFDPSKINLVTTDFQGDLGGGVFNLALADNQRTIYLLFKPNHPPDARTALFARPSDAPLRVNIADLVSQFTSDVDGDPRALAQVGSSTNGTSISIDGGFILLNSMNNEDETIPFWVEDVRPYRPGDTIRMASGAITVQPIRTGIDFTAFRAIEIEWKGESGRLYQLQFRLATDGDWTNQGEPMLGTGQKTSLFERASSTTKFYRVVLLQ